MAHTTTKPLRRHFFFPNPYEDAAFTICPKCQSKTKLRKFPLVIHIEPRQIFLLNMTCRYCPRCDLIIAKKSKLESLMVASFEHARPEIIGNEYLAIGVVDRRDWQRGQQRQLCELEIIERMFVFKDVWKFELAPAGWYPDDHPPR